MKPLGSNGMQQHHPVRHPASVGRDSLRSGRTSLSHAQVPPHANNRVRFPELADEEGSGSIVERVVGIFFAGAACGCVAGLCTILAILYAIVRPFSQSAYRRLAAQLGAAAFLDAVALLLPNTKIYLTGDSDVPSPVGTSILVCNHLLDGDWWAILMLGRCVGLRGSVKVFLRNEILHLNPSTRMNPGLMSSAASTAASATTGSMVTSRSTTSTSTENSTTGGATSSASTTTNSSSSSSSKHHHHTKHDLAIVAKLLHVFLEFPLVNGEDYISDREHLFQLLRSFAENNGDEAPVHLLFFPEGWSLHNGVDGRSILAKSNEFASREGRPQLKHLLLPRTTGFNASLECLRESSPVVYDVTMAYSGYDGSLPPSFELSLQMVWYILRRKFPSEVHVRIKRYSMEEVLQDASWLDKKWAEKDRLLNHFSRHQAFPTDSRGFCRHRVFHTRYHSLETSFFSLLRMLLLPCAVPLLLLLSVPLFWTILWIWLIHKGFTILFPDPEDVGHRSTTNDNDSSVLMGGTGSGSGQTPHTDSAAGTPFFPATPFVSPSVSSWRDMLINNHDFDNDDTT